MNDSYTSVNQDVAWSGEEYILNVSSCKQAVLKWRHSSRLEVRIRLAGSTVTCVTERTLNAGIEGCLKQFKLVGLIPDTRWSFSCT